MEKKMEATIILGIYRDYGDLGFRVKRLRFKDFLSFLSGLLPPANPG